MGRPRSKAKAALPAHMDVWHGKRTTTYYGLIGGERINLGHDRRAAEVKLRELIAGKPTAGTIADMCQQFIAYQRGRLEAGEPRPSTCSPRARRAARCAQTAKWRRSARRSTSA